MTDCSTCYALETSFVTPLTTPACFRRPALPLDEVVEICPIPQATHPVQCWVGWSCLRLRIAEFALLADAMVVPPGWKTPGGSVPCCRRVLGRLINFPMPANLSWEFNKSVRIARFRRRLAGNQNGFAGKRVGDDRPNCRRDSGISGN